MGQQKILRYELLAGAQHVDAYDSLFGPSGLRRDVRVSLPFNAQLLRIDLDRTAEYVDYDCPPIVGYFIADYTQSTEQRAFDFAYTGGPWPERSYLGSVCFLDCMRENRTVHVFGGGVV